MTPAARTRPRLGRTAAAAALSIFIAGCTAEDATQPVHVAPPAPPSSTATDDRTVATAVVPADAGRRYVLAYATHLRPAADRWARYRGDQGWTVHLEAVPPGSDADDAPAAAAARRPASERAVRLREILAGHDRAHRTAAGTAFAVLLLGDAGAEGIPSWPYLQDDPELIDRRDPGYIGDHAYQCLDGDDDLPDVPLGRVPARTVAEADALLDKIARYENAAPVGPWRRRVNFAAGEGHFGGLDLVIEMMFMQLIDRGVPDAFDITLAYAKPTSIYCPPPERLTDTLLERLGEGSLLFNYVGHGSERAFDRLAWSGGNRPMLDRDDLDRLEAPSAARPVALLTCCSAGWFDLPYGEACLGEAMLFHPAGPVAVIAGSRPTHPYANTVFQKDVTRALLVERRPTVGEVDLHATRDLLVRDEIDREIDAIAAPIAAFGHWASTLDELRRTHARLYNLLGDPALRIAYPAMEILDLRRDDTEVSGRIPGLARGTATVTIERGQVAMPDFAVLQLVAGPDDPDFAAKAAHNYPLANDRVMYKLEALAIDGWFRATLPAALPAGAALLKVYIVGTDLEGRPIDAFGAIGIDRPGGGETTEGTE